MKNYFVCTKTGNAEGKLFTENTVYELVENVNGSFSITFDNGATSKFTMEAFCDFCKEANVEGNFATVDDAEKFYLITNETSEFSAGEYIHVDARRVDTSNYCPFVNVVKDHEIFLSARDLCITETVEHFSRAEDIIGVLRNRIGFDCVEVSFKQYYEACCKKEYMPKEFNRHILTQEEYSSVYNAIVEVLDRFNYPHSKYAVCEIIDTWIRNKGKLISAMKSHPNYNGNFQIVFSDEEYRIDTNKSAGSDFTSWVRENMRPEDLLKETVILGGTMSMYENMQRYFENTMPEVKPIFDGEHLILMNYDLFTEKRKMLDEIKFTLKLFNGERYTEESKKEQVRYVRLHNWINDYQEDRINNEEAEFLNYWMPELRARDGQKTTKIVGKIMKKYGIDKIADYNSRFAKYCDDINVIKITRHTVISAHPVDYLTMSFGNSWSSCHTIDKENLRGMPNGYQGQYSSGTVSYMLDGTSVVLYTVDKKYNGNLFYTEPKINRCMFHIGNEKIVQGRCYPQGEDGNTGLYTQFRNLVQRTVAEMYEIPNSWILKKGTDNCYTYTSSSGTHYRDYTNYSDCNVSIYKHSEIKTQRVMIGHEPICVCCGEEHDLESNIACCSEDTHKCAGCGERFDDDDLYEIDGEYYCGDCRFYCNYHEQYEPYDEGVQYIPGYGNVCEDAINENPDVFMRCEVCDSIHVDDNLVYTADGYVCGRCLHDEYEYCVDDETYHRNDDIVVCENCGDTYSRDSVDDLISETEENVYICSHCQAEMREHRVTA